MEIGKSGIEKSGKSEEIGKIERDRAGRLLVIMRTMSKREISSEIDSSVHCFKIFEREKYVINMHRRSVTNQTLKDLKEIARAENVPYSKGNKAQLIERIQKYRDTVGDSV